MPFAFLAPVALAALGLLLAPIVIHMLRRSMSKRLDFPDLRFLRETPSLVRRLTPPNRRWLLLLRCVVIALIAVAAARPAWIGSASSAGSTNIVLIDASASMARPEARDAALTAARDVLARLGNSDLVGIAQFDRRVTWLADITTSTEALTKLSGYAPGNAAADPGAAIAAVTKRLESAPASNRRIVVISDFQDSNGPWTATATEATTSIETVRIENAFDNAYVAGVSVETASDGDRAACSVVRAGRDQRTVGRVVVPLVDGAVAEGLVATRDDASWTLRATDADGFDADDVQYGVVETRGPVVVCDPGAGLPYLVAASRVNEGDARVSSVPRIDTATLSGASNAILSSRALDVAGAAASLEPWIRGGGNAVIFAAASVAGSDAIPGVADVQPSTTSVSFASSPADAAAVALRSSPSRARPVDARTGDDVLGRDGEGRPVIVRRAVGLGSVTVAGFDVSPDAGKLVFDGGFPDVLRTLSRGPSTPALEVGDVLSGLSPDSVVEIGGRRIAIEPTGIVRIDAPGIVRVTSDTGSRTLAVNVSGLESEPVQLSPDEVASLARPASDDGNLQSGNRAAAEQRWPIWRLLLTLALVAAIVELAYVSIARSPSTATPTIAANESAHS